MSFCICPLGRLVHGCPEHAPAEAATLESIHSMLIRIIENQERIMTEQSQQQADIDAATTAIIGVGASVAAVSADLQSATANIQAEIAALKQANPSVNTSALDTAVAALSAPVATLQQTQASVDALETPAAPPAPATPAA